MSVYNRRLDRRKSKNRLNNLRRKHRWGTFLFDCRYHPCRVEKMYYDDVDVRSLYDGSLGSCSLRNCISSDGPITKQLAEEAAAFMKDNHYYDYLRKYHGYTDKDIEHWDAWVKAAEMLEALPVVHPEALPTTP